MEEFSRCDFIFTFDNMDVIFASKRSEGDVNWSSMQDLEILETSNLDENVRPECIIS